MVRLSGVVTVARPFADHLRPYPSVVNLRARRHAARTLKTYRLYQATGDSARTRHSGHWSTYHDACCNPRRCRTGQTKTDGGCISGMRGDQTGDPPPAAR